MELFIAWTLLSSLVVQVMGQEQSCFTSGSIAGAVLGTFFATLVALAIGAFIYFKCCQRKSPGKITAPGANVEAGTRGFDNPCFEGRASGRGGNDRRTSSDGPQAKRQEKGWTQFRLLPLTRSTERKAADDSFVTALERIEVPLRGHDFTGLGFNIAGNMRDGIYVKDVLNRGPASESGQITPGDRIESMTVSFRHMVFEDALTILSYASPYDVTLMLEKSGMQGKMVSPRRATSAVSLVSPTMTVSGNLSGDIGSPSRLVHPLFRSQSIDDLSHVGKADLGAKVSVKLPSMNPKLAHNKLQNQDANIEIETPTLELPTGLEANIGGGANVSGKAKTTKFGVKVLPDLKLKGNAGMQGIDVPDCKVSIDTPSIGVPGPGKVSIGGKAPKMKPGTDVRLRGADVNVNAPDINVEGLKVSGDAGLDLENAKGKKSSFSLKMPRLSFGKANANVKSPKVDIDLPKSDVTIDIADLPGGKLDAELKGKEPKVNLKMPEISVEGPKGSKKVKGKAPGADLSLPSAKVDVNLPEAEITGDAKVNKPKFGIKMPGLSMGMPSLNISSGSGGIDAKVPKISGMDASVTTPELEVNLPDVDIEAKGTKGTAGIKMPTLNVDVPSADILVKPVNLPEMSGTLPDMPDLSLSTKGAKIEGDLSVDMADFEKGDKKGKKSKFSLKMPNMNFGKGGAEIPVHIETGDVNLPEPEISLSGINAPKLDVSLQPPSVEGEIAADIDLTHGKDTRSKFSLKMPSLSIGKHETEISLGKGAAGGIEINRPGISAELPDIDAPKLNVNLPELPSGSIEIPNPEISANFGSIDGTISGPEVTLPGVSAGNVAFPSVDADLKGKTPKFGLKLPNIQCDKPNVDVKLDPGSVNLPEIPDVDVSLEASKLGVDVGGAEIDDASLKMPKIKSDIKMPKIEGNFPQIDISAGLPSVSVKKPKDIEIGMPEIDFDGAKGKKGKFSMKLPSFGFGKADASASIEGLDIDGKLPKPEISLEVPEVPDVNVALKGPKADIDLLDVQGDKKGKKSKFSMKMPHLSLGKTNSGGTSIKPGHLEGSLPKIEGDIEVDTTVKIPGVEVDLPDVDIEGGKGKKSKFSLKMPHMNFGRHNDSEGSVNVDIPSATGAVEIPDANVKVEDLKLDVTLPDVELGAKGKKSKVAVKMPHGVDIEVPKLDISGVADADISVKGPELEVGFKDANLPELKGKKSKFSMKMPNINFGKPQAELNVDGKLAKPEVSVSGPNMPDARIALPKAEIDIETPEFELSDRKDKKSKFSMKTPNISFGKPQLELDIETEGIEGKVPKTDFSVAIPEVPDVNISMKAPEVDIDAPEIDLGDVKGKKSKFSMKMPSLGFGKPHLDVHLEADAKLPKPEVSVAVPEIPDVNMSVNAPEVDISLPEMETGDLKGKKSKFSVKMPNVKMPNVSFGKPEAEVTLEAKGKLPKPEVSVEVPEVPDVNVSVKAPEADFDAPEIDLSDLKGKKPKFSMKMPSLGFGKHHAEADLELGGIEGQFVKPEVSVNLPEVPDVEVSVKAPDVDIEHPDVNLGDMKGKKSKFSMKMPQLSFGKPHLDVDLGGDVQLPKPEVSVAVPEVPDVDISVIAPEVDISHPELNFGDAKGKKPKFSMKMPSMSFGKPHAEVTGGLDGMDAKLLQPELSVNVPKVPDVDISLKAPEVAIDNPELDLGDMKGKKSKFSMKMPNLSFGKPHAEISLGADGKLANPELSVNVPEVPDVDVSFKAPDVDISNPELNFGDAKGKKSKFSMKMPGFNIGKPHMDFEADVKIPKPEISVNVPEVPGVDVSLDAPEVDFKNSDLEIGELKGKKPKFSMKMPNLSFGKPHIDVNLGADGKLPKPELSANVPELPDVNVSLNTPEVDFEHPDLDVGHLKGKKSKFSMKMPSLNFAKPHLDTSLGADGKFPKSEVSVAIPEAPDVSFSVSAPHVDIQHPELDLGDVKGKKSMFSVKMPSLNIGKPELSLQTEGIDVKLPKPELTVNVPEVPDVSVSLNAPEIEISQPDLDLGDAKGQKSKFSVNVPSLNFGKPHAEINLGADGKLPKPELSVNVPEVPDVKISLNAPEVQIEHPDLDLGEAKGKKSKFSMKMPSLGFGKTHADVSFGADVYDAKLPNPEISLPAVNVSLNAPEVDVDLPDIDVSGLKGKKQKFAVKMPGLNFGKPNADVSVDGKLAKPELSVNVPEVPHVNVSLKAPGAEFDHPELDLGDVKGKKSKFSVKMPNLSFGKPQADLPLQTEGVDIKLPKPELSVNVPEVPDVNVAFKAPEVDNSTPDIDVGEAKGKKQKFSVKMPGLSFGKPHADVTLEAEGKLPKPELSVEVPHVPDVKVSLKAPEVDFDEPDLDLGEVKGKKSKFSVKMPSLGFAKPHADVDLQAGGMDSDITVKLPKGSVELPDIETEDLRGKKSKFSIKMPHLNFGKQHFDASVDPTDLDLREASISAAMGEIPNVDAKMQGPRVELDKSAGNVSVTLHEMPDVSVSLNPPSVELQSDDLDLPHGKHKKGKFSMKMPHLSFGKHHSEVALEGNTPEPSLTRSTPSIDLSLKAPSAAISIPRPEFSASLPEVTNPNLDLGDLNAETDIDFPDVKTKKSKFNLKMPHVSIGKPLGEVSGAAIQLPHTEIDMNMPTANVPPAASHLGDVDISADISSPLSGIEKPEMAASSKVNVKLPKLQTEVSGISVEIPSLAIKSEEEMDLDDNKHRLGLKLPKLKPKANLEGDQGGDTGHLSASASIDQPKVHVAFRAPTFGLKTSTPVVKVPATSVSAHVRAGSEVSESPEDDDSAKKEPSKKKFSLKFPKLHMGKAHHELEVDPADVDVNLRMKPPHVELESSEGAAKLPSTDDVKLKKAMKVDVQVPSVAVKEKDLDFDAEGTFKLPRVRVSKNVPQNEHKTAKMSDKESDDDEEEKPKGLRFGIKLKKSKGSSKSSSKTSLEEPLEIKIPRVDLSKKGSVELEAMEGLSPRDRAEMIKKNAKVSAGVRLPKYLGSLPGEEQEPQLLGVTRIPSVVENLEQHGYTEMAVDVPEEFLARDRALKGISSIVPSSFKVMVPLMGVQVEETSKVIVPDKGWVSTSEVVLRTKSKEAAPKDVSANLVTENVVVTDTKGRKAASLGDLTRIVPVNDDSSLERTVSLDLRVGSEAVLSLGTNRRSYPDHPVQDLSRVSAEDLVTSKKMSQGFENLALGAEEAEEKPSSMAAQPPARSVLAIEVNDAVWNPNSLYVSSYGPDAKAFSPNSYLAGAAIRGRNDESLSADTTITLESTPTASSNSSSRTSPLPLTEVRSSFTTVTLSNGSHCTKLMDLTQAELKNVTFTPVFHQGHMEESIQRATEEEDDPGVSTFAVVRQRFEQLSRHSSAVEVGKANDGHRATVETNLRWEDVGSQHESPVHKPVMQIRPVVEEGALSKTVVISGLQLDQCDTSLQEAMSVESPVPTLEKPV